MFSSSQYNISMGDIAHKAPDTKLSLHEPQLYAVLVILLTFSFPLLLFSPGDEFLTVYAFPLQFC